MDSADNDYIHGGEWKMGILLDKLAVYGMEVELTMERFVQDEELYADCLFGFIQDNEFSLLEQAMAKQDYAAAMDYAHSLKGVVGNLGLEPLFRVVCDLVEALRRNDYAAGETLHSQVKDEWHKLQDILAKIN